MIEHIDFKNMLTILSIAGAVAIVLYYKGKELGLTIREALQIIITIGCIRFLIYAPYIIPSGSMIPTLLIGDQIVVNRFVFGFGQFSFPWGLAVFNDRILVQRLPKVGEVVVFRPPHDPHTPFIKRLIGREGDQIQMISGVLHINGKPCKLRRIKDRLSYDDSNPSKKRVAKQYIETLPNGVEHVIQHFDDFSLGQFDNTGLFIVPKGHYFMVGDNRNRSSDSRDWGFVAEKNLIGRADAVAWSFDRTKPWFKWIISWRKRGLQLIK